MNERPATYRHLWGLFAFVVLASFAVLGGFGFRIASEAPPIPDKVYAGDKLLIDGETIRAGQNVWQSLGGMEVGSVWGHGAYIAPDWSADWLHRELVFVLDRWARDEGAAGYDSLPPERQAALRERLKQRVRGNGYDPSTGVLTIDPVRGEAFEANAAHYAEVFANGRPEYALPAGALTDPERQRAMSAFFFWTSWACATNRPGLDITYTQNWPHEPLIDNRPTADAVIWSVLSFVLLLAGVGGMVWYPHPGRLTTRRLIRMLFTDRLASRPGAGHPLHGVPRRGPIAGRTHDAARRHGRILHGTRRRGRIEGIVTA